MGFPVKKDGLEIHPLAAQFVVYDAGTELVHYLNPTAAFVLEFCDGRHGPEAIATSIQEAYALPSAPLDEVRECLATLRKQNLITG